MPYSLNAIVSEVEAGLENEKPRLEEAQFNRLFYEGCFEQFRSRPPEGYEPYRYRRTSPFSGFVVHQLTRNLYRTGPARTLPEHPGASEWLNRTYRAWWADAAWQEIDRMAAWGGFAAWQVSGTADPDRPVKYDLWGADELCVWLDDADPKLPVAVGTLDRIDVRRRLRVWTADEVLTFETSKWGNETAGKTAFVLRGREPHPYGIVPFAFTHWELPLARFTTRGIGTGLREVNDWLNYTLTETGDSLRYDVRPVTTAYNVRADWRPPPARPGSIWHVPASRNAANAGPEPRLEHHQADPGYVGATWEDLGQYLGHVLEMHGVPRAAFRMEQSSNRSGASIVAEQLPLLDWAESRQRPYGYYEEGLAKVACRVGAAWGGAGVPAAELLAAARDPGLVLRWGRMWANLPGPDRDQADDWRLEKGLASEVDLLMEREGLSREEAEAKLEQVAKDREKFRSLHQIDQAGQPVEKPAAGATGEGEGGEVTSDEPIGNRESEE